MLVTADGLENPHVARIALSHAARFQGALYFELMSCGVLTGLQRAYQGCRGTLARSLYRSGTAMKGTAVAWTVTLQLSRPPKV